MGNKNIFSKIKKYISKLLDSKLLIVIALVLIFLTMLYVYIRPVDSNLKNDSKEVVAYIDGEKLRFNEVEKRAEEAFYIDKNNIIENIGSDNYKRELIKYVVYEDILYRKAKEENVHVTRQEIEDTYDNLEKFITGKIGLDEDEFKSKYVDDKNKLVKSMRKTIKAYKYLDKKTQVSDSEARAYYDANKDKFREGVYRDIFISTVDNSGKKLSDEEIADAEKRANAIYKKLEEGYKFEDLEEKYSEDIGGTIPGGLGDLEMSFTDKNLRKKISTLKEGEYIEKPLKSIYGYHIIKRIGTEEESFDKVKEEIKSMLSYKKQIKLMEELMKEYNVEIKDKYKIKLGAADLLHLFKFLI